MKVAGPPQSYTAAYQEQMRKLTANVDRLMKERQVQLAGEVQERFVQQQRQQQISDLRKAIDESLQKIAPSLAAVIKTPQMVQTAPPAPAPATPPIDTSKLSASQKILLGVQQERSLREQAGHGVAGPVGQPATTQNTAGMRPVDKISKGLEIERLAHGNPGSDRLRYH